VIPTKVLQARNLERINDLEEISSETMLVQICRLALDVSSLPFRSDEGSGKGQFEKFSFTVTPIVINL
jgi:hypothetical protein